jgi:hypothetical protein
LEQVWIVRNVTGGFLANAGGFFQRVIASSAGNCPLRHHYLFFFPKKKQIMLTGFLFPQADFVQALAKLGYDINDGITNLMPIVVYCEDE